MPQFVLLYHECPPQFDRQSHWDLMLETGGTLRTWAMVQLPSGWEAARARTADLFPMCADVGHQRTVVATPLADHRIDYLQLEGPLTGSRGEVRRIDAGTYEAIEEDSEKWQVSLTGAVIQGTITLRDSKLSL